MKFFLLIIMFEKHCQICGIDVKKDNDIKRFGKYFCNDEHAKQFLAEKEEEQRQRAEYERQHPRRRGGCC